MIYDFDKTIERSGTSCYKHDKREECFGSADVIPMWIADMDFEVAPFIADAVKQRAQYCCYGYEFLPDGFYESIAEWMGRRHGWKVERDWITFNPGVVTGFVVCEFAFAAQGEGIVIQPPVYPPFARTVNTSGRKILDNPLKIIDGRYEIDFEDLDRQLSKAKVFMLCNPHNPTGRVFTREELTRMGEMCVKHDVVIISDEIHSDLVYAPHRHIPTASLSDEIAQRTVTLIAPSKTFNTAAFSTSAAIIPNKELRDTFMAQMDKMHVASGSVFGGVALEAAYRGGDEWLGQLLDYLKGNIDYVKQFIATHMPSIRTFDVQGTYLIWLDFSQLGMSADELTEFLVKKAGLGLNCGRTFGKEGEGYARMNIATSRSIVERAMEQLRQAYSER